MRSVYNENLDDFYREEDNREEQILSNLTNVVEDASNMVEFSITTLGVEPKHCVVMASDADYKNILKEVRDWVGGKNTTKSFFNDGKDKEEHIAWQSDPHRFIPEAWLPAIKASYNFSSNI